jgi:hypothetical protein
MTLLLNLVSPSGIHVSSDYRLTDIVTRGPIEDFFGSKQLSFSFDTWSVHLSFTGIAQIGGRKTLDWISEAMRNTPKSADPELAMATLAAAATSEFRRIPKSLRQLTMVAAMVRGGGPARLFVLSCSERPIGPPLATPLDQFEVYKFSADSPQVFVFGYTSAVSQADRKFLRKLNRGRDTPEEIRASLARINTRSAKRSHDLISPGCLVTSVLPGGNVASENFGCTPGIPAHMMVSPEMAKLIAKSMGKRPTFVQSRGARAEKGSVLTTQPMNLSEGNMLTVQFRYQGPGSPMFATDTTGSAFTAFPGSPGSYGDENPEQEDMRWAESHQEDALGEPRTIAFSSPTTSAPLIGTDGSTLGTITIGGKSETVSVRKNQLARIVLNTLTVQLDPSTRHQGPPISVSLEIPAIPTIDGVQRRLWTYTIDVFIDGTFTCSIRRMSMAFRSANYKLSMPALSSSEELAMAILRKQIVKSIPLLPNRIRKDRSKVTIARLPDSH